MADNPGPGGEHATQKERTALAWQRTALAILAGAAVVSRLAVERVGALGLLAVVVAVPLAGWVVWANHRRARPRTAVLQGGRTASRRLDGRSPALLCLAVFAVGLTELLVLLT